MEAAGGGGGGGDEGVGVVVEGGGEGKAWGAGQWVMEGKEGEGRKGIPFVAMGFWSDIFGRRLGIWGGEGGGELKGMGGWYGWS